MNLAQTIKVYIPEMFFKKKKRKKKKDDATDVKAEDFYGPDEGGMGPSKALGSPE
jgi:hypothetical protein